VPAARDKTLRSTFARDGRLRYGTAMAKRHHYVPVTYLRNFTDASGHLLVFRKDEPERPFR
jgi:hypothetical protein